MLLLWLFLIIPVSSDELIFVQTIWRHGARTPTRSFPTDTNNTDFWPQGLGQLTQAGMWEQFELGRTLAKMYKQDIQLLNSDYDANQIYVRSTDWNRTLMSAYSNLAGMYPETALNETDWPQPWNPIPVHTVNQHHDSLLWMSSNCPKAHEHKTNVIYKSEKWLEIQQKNEKLFQWLSDMSGLPTDLGNIWILSDIFAIEKRENRTWVPWMNETLMIEIENINVLSDSFLFGDEFLARLRGGQLLEQMVNRMIAKTQCKSDCSWLDKLKYYAYSAHDMTIFALLSTLGARNLTEAGLPGIASCVLMELWKKDSDYLVKVLYRDNYKMDFKPMTAQIEGCDEEFCPLETFRKRSQPYFVADWEKECGLTLPPVPAEEGIDGFKIATIVLGVVCGLLLLIIIGLIFQMKRSGKVGRRSDSYPM